MSATSRQTELVAPIPVSSELGSAREDQLGQDRQWVEAVLAGERRVLEMIARSSSLCSVLEALCRLVEQIAPGSLCSISLLGGNGLQLCRGAAPSLPTTYTDAVGGHSIADGWGPCGMAAFRKEPVIVSDVTTGSPCAEYRDLALGHGLQACWSNPILGSDGKALGTFAVYCRQPRSPTTRHLNLMEQFAHLASIAIERTRGEEALRRSESRFQGILEIADDAIISVDSDQRILLFNQGAEKVFGYSGSELIGKPLDLLLPLRFAGAHKEHVAEFATSSEVSRTMAQRREVFGRRKDGREFPAEASISKLRLGEEVIFTVILRDVTERKNAAESLRASAQLARGQTEALTRTLDALAKESDPDRLIEHVLRTITQQLDAHSSSIWLRRENTGLVSFEFAFEEGRLLTSSDAALAKISPVLRVEDVWPWPEVFRTGKPSVLEDIRQGPSFPWRDHVLSLGVITLLIVPMLMAGQVEGVVGIRFIRKRSFRTEEMDLAQALAHQAMLACQLRRLSRQSRQAAVVAERNRMARDIHDTLAQGFTGVIVQLEAMEEAMSQGLTARASEHLARAGALARESLHEARRSVRALRPQSLEETDIYEALQRLIRKMTAGTSIHAEFNLFGRPADLPAEWEENLLRIVQEVLTNVLRHAQATRFNARLAFGEQEIRLILRDNGKGFDLERRHDGFGLRGIRERAGALGGQLSIESFKGEGSTISIVLPLPAQREVITT
jgi:PAS domain S-box-containing protein